MLQDVVVVGASLAGLRAAETFRTEGYDGRLTLIGAEPHLPYDRPPLSKKVLAGEWEPDRIHLRKPSTSTATSGSTCASARGPRRSTPVGRRVVLADGERGRLRRAHHRHRRRAPPPAGPARPRRRLRAAHARRLAGPAGRARRRPAPGRRDRGRLHRRRGRRHRAGSRASRSRCSRRCRSRSVRGLGPAMGAAIADLHRDHGVDVRLGVGVDGHRGRRAGRAGAADRRHGRRRRRGRGRASASRRPPAGWRAAGSSCATASCATPRWRPARPACTPPATWRAGPTSCSTRRCASSTGPTRPSRAPPPPATSWPRPPAAPATPYAPVPFFWSDQYDARIQFLGPGQRRRRGRGRPRLGRRAAASWPSTGATAASAAVFGMSQPKLVMPYRKLLGRRRELGRRPGPRRSSERLSAQRELGSVTVVITATVGTLSAVMADIRQPLARHYPIVPLVAARASCSPAPSSPSPSTATRPAPPSTPPTPATAASCSCPAVDGRYAARRRHRQGRERRRAARRRPGRHPPRRAAGRARRRRARRAQRPVGPGRRRSTDARPTAAASRRWPASCASCSQNVAELRRSPPPARDPAHDQRSRRAGRRRHGLDARSPSSSKIDVLETIEVGERVELVLAWAKDLLAELQVARADPRRRGRGHGEAAARVPAPPAAPGHPQGAGRRRRRARRRLPRPRSPS